MNFITNYIKENPVISLILGFLLYRFLLLQFLRIILYNAYYYAINLNLIRSNYPGLFDNNINPDKYLLDNQKVSTNKKHILFYYWKRKSYPEQFYSAGRAKVIQNLKV